MVDAQQRVNNALWLVGICIATNDFGCEHEGRNEEPMARGSPSGEKACLQVLQENESCEGINYCITKLGVITYRSNERPANDFGHEHEGEDEESMARGSPSSEKVCLQVVQENGSCEGSI